MSRLRHDRRKINRGGGRATPSPLPTASSRLGLLPQEPGSYPDPRRHRGDSEQPHRPLRQQAALILPPVRWRTPVPAFARDRLPGDGKCHRSEQCPPRPRLLPIYEPVGAESGGQDDRHGGQPERRIPGAPISRVVPRCVNALMRELVRRQNTSDQPESGLETDGDCRRPHHNKVRVSLPPSRAKVFLQKCLHFPPLPRLSRGVIPRF